MTEPFLNREEVSSLQRVLQEANRVYAKEFRTTSKSDFSLWRVLAAFRLLHRDSPESLYNTIIYIAKIQNPQTYKQWTRAVDDLGKLRKNAVKQSNNYYRPNSSMHTRTYQNSFNRSRVNSREHLQSKSFAQIKVPEGVETSKANFVEDYSQKDVSQTNAETNTRQYLTKPQSRDYHPKVHYISFEPYSKCEETTQHDKENINSTNVGESYRRESAYQYIEAIQRDLTRTSKQSQSRSPIDQSFIRNMSANESPYLIAKLKSEMSDPYEDQMRLRATTVHTFNLQLKGFNSLLANFLVSKKGKDDDIKAARQGIVVSLRKGLSGLKTNVVVCRRVREQQQRADIFSCAHTYKKTFSLLKFIYDLNRRRHGQVKTEKYNKSNYEFILALLLKIQSTEEGHSEWIDFQGKIDEMIHEDQAAKLCLIAKYFGQHSWIKEDNVQQLLCSYKKAIYKQVFKAFTLNKVQNCNLAAKRQKFLMKNCFGTLKTRWGRIRAHKKKMMEAQAIRNRVLLQKVMKVFQETVYSTKLYSKRCEYLHKKYTLKLKMVAYIRWIEQARKKSKQSENVKRKAASSCKSLMTFVMKYSFRKVYEEMQQMNQKTNNLVETIQSNRKANFFTHFKDMIQDTQCKWEVSERYNLKLCKRSLICWKDKTKLSKVLNNAFRVLTHFHIRQKAIPNLREAVELYRKIRFSQQQIMKRSMETFKRWVRNAQKQRESLSSKLQQKLQFFRRNEGITAFRLFYTRQKDIKQKNRLTQNIYQLKIILMRRKKGLFLSRLGLDFDSKVRKNNQKRKLKDIIQLWQIKNVFHRLTILNSEKTNFMRLKQKIYEKKRQQTIEKMNLCIIEMKIRKIQSIRKSLVVADIARMSLNSYQRQERKMETAKQYHERQLSKKVFATFRQLAKMSHQVKYLVQQTGKNKTYGLSKRFIAKWQQDHRLQKIGNRIAKKELFSNLRQNFAHRYNSQLLIWIRTERDLRSGLENLTSFLLDRTKAKQIEAKSQWLSKSYALHKLKMNFNVSLVHAKYLFMVFKFRALKLSSQVFTNWKGLLFNKPKQVRPKRNRNERLSTDYIIQ